MKLTSKQYQILLDLYHELNDAFLALPRIYQDAFHARLHSWPEDQPKGKEDPFKKKYKRPDPQTCAHCGKQMPGSDLALLSQAIRRHKPACSYKCNKALGQVD